jgi:pyrroloquinoline quinone biosynthesis protein D
MTNALAPTLVPKIASLYRMQWEQAQQCHVLLYPEGMVKLGGSAGEIMKRVDGKTSIEAILEALEAQFPGVPLAADVYKFLEVAYGNGWLKSVELK